MMAQWARSLLLFSVFISFALAPTASFAQKKKSQPAPSLEDELGEELDGANGGDDLEKELQAIEGEDYKDLDVEATPAPAIQSEAPPPDESLDLEAASEPAPAPVEETPVEQAPTEVVDEPALDEPPQEPPPPEIKEEPVPIVAEQPTESQSTDDPPDQEFEERMKRIYQKFYAQQISDEEWSGIVGDRVSESYNVQRGDTLWGISVTFFRNGFFWPKLWQLNSGGITNPHEINVGDRIVFSMGTLGQEPELKLAREADQEFIVKETENNAEGPARVTVPGRKRYRPVLENIPPSLPVTESEESGYDETGFAITAQRSPHIPEPFPITSLLTENPPAVDGEIVSVESGGSTAGILQKVYVRLKNGGVGDIYSAFEVRKSMGGGFIFGSALPIEFQGEIEVVDKLKSGLFKAIVISNFDQLQVGAKLSSGPVPEGEFSKKGRINGAEAKIIGGPLDETRALFGTNSILFLEGGSQKGIETGDIMPVFRNESLRIENGPTLPSSNVIGRLKILNVTPKFATAVVVEASEDIRTGDRTGAVKEEE